MSEEILQEQADNDTEEEVVVDEEDSVDSDSPTENKKRPDETTKAFSERLNKERERIREEERAAIREEEAQSLGYSSWEEYVEDTTNKKLLDQGMDPDVVKPVLKDFLKNDPEYLEAMKYKKEKEKLEAELWAKSELERLNVKFGKTFTTIDQLDDDTIEMWNKGISLEKAYAANNYTDLQEVARKKAQVKQTSKNHLKDVTGGGENEEEITLTDEEFKNFQDLNPDITKEQVIEWKKKRR